MRVDNGEPLGSPKADTTSALALWLIGNDIDMIFNRPARPQSNGKVERMQDVSARWAEVHRAKNIEDLQLRLNQQAVFQREKFAVSRLGKRTRLEVYPTLESSRRVYDTNDFSVKRIYEYLSRKVYQRWTSKYGQIFIFGQRVSVGRDYKYQYVNVKLNPDSCQWEISAEKQILKKYQAESLTLEKINDLKVYQKRHKV